MDRATLACWLGDSTYPAGIVATSSVDGVITVELAETVVDATHEELADMLAETWHPVLVTPMIVPAAVQRTYGGIRGLLTRRVNDTTIASLDTSLASALSAGTLHADTARGALEHYLAYRHADDGDRPAGWPIALGMLVAIAAAPTTMSSPVGVSRSQIPGARPSPDWTNMDGPVVGDLDAMIADAERQRGLRGGPPRIRRR